MEPGSARGGRSGEAGRADAANSAAFPGVHAPFRLSEGARGETNEAASRASLPEHGGRRALWAFALSLACTVAVNGARADSTEAVPAAPSRVLLLFSNGRFLPAAIEAERALRDAVAAAGPVQVFDEFLDEPRFSGPAFAQTVAAYLRDKYRERSPDVIVAIGGDALRFLLEHRSELFPGVPVVHLGVIRSVLRSIQALPADVVGTSLDDDYTATIDQALRWHPRARRLVLVTGTSAQDRVWEARLRQDTARFADRVAIEFLAGLPASDLVVRLRALGPDTVVFTPGFFRDGAGREVTPRDMVEVMAAEATAPVYGPHGTFVGTGVVGGYMVGFTDVGREAGLAVQALLAGATRGSLRVPETAPVALHVDWRQVQRWGIDEKAIPRGAVVHFREPTFLQEHRTAAIATVALVLLEAALIGGLLVERRRRWRAQQRSREDAAKLAHMDRVNLMGQLAFTLAHEVSTPIAAAINDARAARRYLDADPAGVEGARTSVLEIEAHGQRAREVIQRIRGALVTAPSHQVAMDLGDAVREAAELVRGLASQRGVALDVRTMPAPLRIHGDPVQLQQVITNLLLNAVDAAAGQPPERRSVSLLTETGERTARLTVRDRGGGVPAANRGRIFEAFSSTKPGGLGLGLNISRSIVLSHGGAISLLPDDGAGAAFLVEIPLDVEPAPHAEEAS
jgi:signal transduction histidine kinase